VVLQGTGHDFAGRSRPFVHQHHQGHLFDAPLRGRDQLRNRVIASATQVVLWDGLVHKAAVFQLAIGRNHGHVLRQKGGGQGHCRIQQAAGVVAQVQHQPLELGVLAEQVFHLAGKVFDRAFLEL